MVWLCLLYYIVAFNIAATKTIAMAMTHTTTIVTIFHTTTIVTITCLSYMGTKWAIEALCQTLRLE